MMVSLAMTFEIETDAEVLIHWNLSYTWDDRVGHNLTNLAITLKKRSPRNPV